MYKVWVVSYHCNINNCHENAQCTNTERSFTCSCYLGYTGDGVNCASKILYSFYMTILHFSRVLHLAILCASMHILLCISSGRWMLKLRLKLTSTLKLRLKGLLHVLLGAKIRKLWFIAWKTNLLAYIRFHLCVMCVHVHVCLLWYKPYRLYRVISDRYKLFIVQFYVTTKCVANSYTWWSFNEPRLIVNNQMRMWVYWCSDRILCQNFSPVTMTFLNATFLVCSTHWCC